MDNRLISTGIAGVGDVPWGTHCCMFYDTQEDLLDVLLRYFKAGLENHESCLWVTPEPLSVEEAQRVMREAVAGFEQHLNEGQFEIVSYTDWYLSGGHFDSQRVLQDWIDKHDQALTQDYAGLRCTGNTFWLENHQWASFAEYEAEIDKVISGLRIMVLCTYPLARCSASDVLDVVHHHQFTVAKRNGVWEHLEGLELKHAHDEIRKMNAGLERRVAQRTIQLAAANQQLKAEIAERKAVEEALRESDKRFRALFENVSDAIQLVSGEGTILYATPSTSRMLGYSAEEFVGRSAFDLIHPDDRERERGTHLEVRIPWQAHGPD